MHTNSTAEVLAALLFACRKHRDQRRKGADAAPYVNHLVEVAEVIARVSDDTRATVLQAAILHDTLEDTATTPDELDQQFGADVRRIVQEVTDDKRLPKQERKRLQVEHAPSLSLEARLIKIADKISNVRELIESPPADWTLERMRDYIDWAEQVVNGCRGANAALESHFDQVAAHGRQRFAS